SSGLDLNYAPSTITKQQPTEGELDSLFESMYDDYFGCQPLATVENVTHAQEPQVRQTSTASTTIADNVPIPTNSSSHATNIPITSQDVDELNPNAMVDGNTFVNPFVNSSTSVAVASSSSQNNDREDSGKLGAKGLLKFKYHKEHLCPSSEQGKSKRASHPPKPVPNSRQRLHLLHMDLCGPMRIASINGKRYILVIVDDYSRYTWVHFLRSKDEAPKVIITFLKRITVLL
nr:ribonuclease H-like domain-containing protein [Tanacetum cinerariifolium]